MKFVVHNSKTMYVLIEKGVISNRLFPPKTLYKDGATSVSFMKRYETDKFNSSPVLLPEEFT